MNNELKRDAEALSAISETHPRKNHLFWVDSPEALTLLKNRRSMENNDILGAASRQPSFIAGVDYIIDSLGAIDVCFEITLGQVDVFIKGKNEIRNVLACNALLYALLSLTFLSSEKVDLIAKLEPEFLGMSTYYQQILDNILTGKKHLFFKTYLSDMISVSGEQFLCPSICIPVIRTLLDDTIRADGAGNKENEDKNKNRCDNETKKGKDDVRSFQKLLNPLLVTTANLLNAEKGTEKSTEAFSDSYRQQRRRTRNAYNNLAAHIESIFSNVLSETDPITVALFEVMKENIFHYRFLSDITENAYYSYAYLMEKEMPIVFGRAKMAALPGSSKERYYVFKNLVELVTILAVDFCGNNYNEACATLRQCLNNERFKTLLEDKPTQSHSVSKTSKKAKEVEIDLARAKAAYTLLGGEIVNNSPSSEALENLLSCCIAEKSVSAENHLEKGADGRCHLKGPASPFDSAFSWSWSDHALCIKFENDQIIKQFKDRPDSLTNILTLALSAYGEKSEASDNNAQADPMK